MPWKDVNVMELRIQFIADWMKKKHTVIDLPDHQESSAATTAWSGQGWAWHAARAKRCRMVVRLKRRLNKYWTCPK